jgi:hypothetical protein
VRFPTIPLWIRRPPPPRAARSSKLIPNFVCVSRADIHTASLSPLPKYFVHTPHLCSHLLLPPTSTPLLKEYQTASTHKCAILDTNKISYHIDARCRNQVSWFHQHPSRLDKVPVALSQSSNTSKNPTSVMKERHYQGRNQKHVFARIL